MERDSSVSRWVEFDKNDLEQNVKIYKAQTIAFRVWFDVEVSVNGKG